MLFVFLLATLTRLGEALAQDQDDPVYENQVQNLFKRLQLRTIETGTDTGWVPNPWDGNFGWFLKPSDLTRVGWRLGDISDPSSSEIIYSLNTSMALPFEAKIAQMPNPPENALNVSSGYYSTVHATFPTSKASSRAEAPSGEHRRRSADLFDGPFTAIPFSNKWFTVYSDGCPFASTLTTTVTDAVGNTTSWTDTLPTDFVEIDHDFPADIALPFTFTQMTEPFAGNVSGIVRTPPFQIGLGGGDDAPSLYSYYQIVSYFCGQQEDD